MHDVTSHEQLWQQHIAPLLTKGRIPQAFLFVGPFFVNRKAFAQKLMRALLCEKSTPNPAVELCCAPCQFISRNEHPDVAYLGLDGTSKNIKIDQIRTIQNEIYKTPQCGLRRFVVIDPANKMNLAAANALLKILEEPPSHTMFILLAEQIQTLPATVVSRCQCYTFPILLTGEALFSGEYDLGNEARATLLKKKDQLINELYNITQGTLSPCVMVKNWADYNIEDMIWMLYLLLANLMQAKLTPTAVSTDFSRLAEHVHSRDLFRYMDSLNAILQKINHTISMNETLALESWLMHFLPALKREA